MYVCIYVKMAEPWGSLTFTKLSFALFSLAQPFDQMGSIPEYIFVTLMHSCYFCMMHPGVTLGLRGSMLNGMTNVDTITSK